MHGRVTQPDISRVKDKDDSTFQPNSPLETLCAAMLLSMHLMHEMMSVVLLSQSCYIDVIHKQCTSLLLCLFCSANLMRAWARYS